MIVLGSLYAWFGMFHNNTEASAYGAKLAYPAKWKESPYQFHTTVNTTKAGLVINSPTNKVHVAIAPKYLGDMKSEHPESANIQLEAMLVSSTPLKDLPGVLDVQTVKHYYGVNGVSNYVASDNLITEERFRQLGLELGKMHAVTASGYETITTKSPQPEVAIGFNSQEPLTQDQAVAWLQSSEAQVAHTILLSTRPSI